MLRSRLATLLLWSLCPITLWASEPNSPADRINYPNLDAFEKVYQPYLVNLSADQPTYFLVGANPSDSKFQFSFKYQLFGQDKAWAKSQPWITGFHFGYTQTSFWDLKTDSKPFEDTSYKPELFYLSPNLDFGLPGVRGIFVRTGLQHESNGRGGVDSRSTNFAYIKPMFFFYGEHTQLGFLIAPKLWLYVDNDDETNPDLHEYRGYWNLDFKFGKADGLIFGTNVYWAQKGGSFQADLTYPLHKLFKGNLDLYLQLQYVDVLAEKLITYQDRKRAWRIGLAIVR